MRRVKPALGFLGGAWVVAVLFATPVSAQMGALSGRVVDEAGAPIADAEVKLVYTGESFATNSTLKTDRNGRFAAGGLTTNGVWAITASKSGMSATLADIRVPNRSSEILPDIVLRKGAVAPPAGTAAENAARAKEAAEQKAILDAVNAALAANDTPLAIAKLTEATTKFQGCVGCYVRLGSLYVQTKDAAKAEDAYKAALKVDENAVEAWEGLAGLYNSQKRFAEAGEASKKALALQPAGAGGGDPVAIYNAGVILLNQSKMAEARAQFERAVQLDPKMADAHFQLAMTLMNEGKMPEALKSLEQYLTLAPAGSNADTAKSLIPELKKMIK
jgi:Tfp pilus assembly protein PilF